MVTRKGLYVLMGLLVVFVLYAFVATNARLTTISDQAVVSAEESDEDDDGEAEQTSALSYLKHAGVAGIVIIVLSIVGVALIIENIISLKRDKLVPPDILGEIEGLFDEEKYEEVLELCNAEECFVTKILGAGLAKMGMGFDRMNEAVMDAGEEEATKLHQKLGYLSLIANIAPMLGLLGTVLGMMAAFNKIASMGHAVTPADLASGISEALITTCMGLMVAIPISAAFMLFRNKLITIIIEVGAITGELMDKFRPVQEEAV